MEGESIKVVVRIRDLIERERDEKIAFSAEGNSVVQLSTKKSWPFDHVIGPKESNIDIYGDVASDLIDATVQGYNATLFAYGQTSSGKTHTMMGTQQDPGIIRQAVDHLFSAIEDSADRRFLMQISYIEVYNEKVVDLLVPYNERTALKIRESEDGEVYVEGAKTVAVCSEEEVFDLMEFGSKSRHVAETKMNDRSSRSHTIFRILLESANRLEDDPVDDENDEGTQVTMSQLNLVDLAGSERASQTGAEGIRLREGSNINKSLMVLSQVIQKLSSGTKSGHINFRDSKLTRILQNSLGGNAKTSVVCAVTPAMMSEDQTLSTLRFASQAKQIKNHAIVNEVVDDKARIVRLEKELAKYQEENEALKLKKLENNENDVNYAEMAEELKEELKRERKAREEEIQKIQELQKKIIISSHPPQPSRKSIIAKMKKNRRETWAGPNFPKFGRMSLAPRLDTFKFSPPAKAPGLSILQEIEETKEKEDDLLPAVVMPPPSFVSTERGRDRAKKSVKFQNEDDEIFDESPPKHLGDFSQLDVSEADRSAFDFSMDFGTPKAVIRDRYKRVSQQLSRKDNELRRLQSEYEELQDFTRLEKELVGERSLSTGSNATGENSDLLDKVKFLEKSFADAESLNLKYSKDLRVTKDELEMARLKLEDLELKYTDVSKNEAELKEKLATLQSQQVTAEQELKVLRDRSQLLENEKADFDFRMELAVSKKDREIEDLRKVLELAYEDLAQLEENANPVQIRERYSKSRELEKKIMDMEAQLTTAQEEKELAVNEFQKQSVLLEEMKARTSELELELSEVRQARQDTENELQSVGAVRLEVEQTLHSLEVAKSEAEQKLQAVEAAKLEAEERLQTVEAAKMEAEQKLQAVEAAKLEAEHKLQTLDEARQEAEQKLETAESARQEAELKLREAEACQLETEQKLGKVEAACQEARQRIEQLEAERSVTASSLENLQPENSDHEVVLQDEVGLEHKRQSVDATKSKVEQQLLALEAAHKETEQRLKAAEEAKLEAEYKLQTAEVARQEAEERLKTLEESRTNAKDSIESELQREPVGPLLEEVNRKLEQSENVRLEMEQKLESVEASLHERLEATEKARQEAEESVKTSEAARQQAEDELKSVQSVLVETEEKLKTLEAGCPIKSVDVDPEIERPSSEVEGKLRATEAALKKMELELQAAKSANEVLKTYESDRPDAYQREEVAEASSPQLDEKMQVMDETRSQVEEKIKQLEADLEEALLKHDSAENARRELEEKLAAVEEARLEAEERFKMTEEARQQQVERVRAAEAARAAAADDVCVAAEERVKEAEAQRSAAEQKLEMMTMAHKQTEEASESDTAVEENPDVIKLEEKLASMESKLNEALAKTKSFEQNNNTLLEAINELTLANEVFENKNSDLNVKLTNLETLKRDMDDEMKQLKAELANRQGAEPGVTSFEKYQDEIEADETIDTLSMLTAQQNRPSDNLREQEEIISLKEELAAKQEELAQSLLEKSKMEGLVSELQSQRVESERNEARSAAIEKLSMTINNIEESFMSLRGDLNRTDVLSGDTTLGPVVGSPEGAANMTVSEVMDIRNQLLALQEALQHFDVQDYEEKKAEARRLNRENDRLQDDLDLLRSQMKAREQDAAELKAKAEMNACLEKELDEVKSQLFVVAEIEKQNAELKSELDGMRKQAVNSSVLKDTKDNLEFSQTQLNTVLAENDALKAKVEDMEAKILELNELRLRFNDVQERLTTEKDKGKELGVYVEDLEGQIERGMEKYFQLQAKVEDFEKEKLEVQMKNENLMSQISSLKSSLSEEVESRECLAVKLEEMQTLSESRGTAEELESCRNEIERLKSACDELTAVNARRASEMKDLEAKFAKELEDSDSEKQALSDKVAELTQEVAELREQRKHLNRVEAENSDMREALKVKCAEIGKHKEDIKQLQSTIDSKLASSASDAETMEALIKEHRKSQQEATEELEAANRKIEALCREKAGLEAKIAELVDEDANKEAQITEMISIMETVRSDFEAAKEREKNVEASLATEKALTEQASQEKAELEQNVERHLTTIEKKEEEIKEWEETVESLNDEIEMGKKYLRELHAKLEQTQEELRQAKQEIDQFDSSTTTLNEQLLEKNSKISELEEEIKNLASKPEVNTDSMEQLNPPNVEIVNLQRDLKATSSERDSLTSQLVELTKEHDSLKSTCRSLEDDLAYARMKVEQLNEKNLKMSEDIDKSLHSFSVDGNSSFVATKEDYVKQIQVLQERIKRYDGFLEKVNSECDQLEEEKNAAEERYETELSNLRKELQETKEQCENFKTEFETQRTMVEKLSSENKPLSGSEYSQLKTKIDDLKLRLAQEKANYASLKVDVDREELPYRKKCKLLEAELEYQEQYNRRLKESVRLTQSEKGNTSIYVKSSSTSANLASVHTQTDSSEDDLWAYGSGFVKENTLCLLRSKNSVLERDSKKLKHELDFQLHKHKEWKIWALHLETKLKENHVEVPSKSVIFAEESKETKENKPMAVNKNDSRQAMDNNKSDSLDDFTLNLNAGAARGAKRNLKTESGDCAQQ